MSFTEMLVLDLKKRDEEVDRLSERLIVLYNEVLELRERVKKLEENKND